VVDIPAIDTSELERMAWHIRLLRTVAVNPYVNFAMTRKSFMRLMKRRPSELGIASIEDPGGWRSMRAAYENKPGRNWADRAMVRYGVFPMALRNRKRISAQLLAALIDDFKTDHVHLVAVGAGGGNNVLEAMAAARNKNAKACLIDLNAGAFDYGREVAERYGLTDCVRFVQGDACQIDTLVDYDPELVTLIGIIEYIADDGLLKLLAAMYEAMDHGGYVLVNSISKRHGMDRFLRRVFRLHLTYRSADDVEALLRQAGFAPCHRQAEPLGVYNLLIGRKE